MVKRVLTILLLVAWFAGNIQSQPFVVGDTTNAASTYVNIPTLPCLSSLKALRISTLILISTMQPISAFSVSICLLRCSREVGEMAYPLSNIQFAVVADSSGDFDTLSVGKVVKEHPYWYYRSEGIYFNFFHDESPPPPWGNDYSHGICKKPNTYVGFREINPSDTLYGWFLLDLPDPFTVRSFAISRTIPFSVIEPADKLKRLPDGKPEPIPRQDHHPGFASGKEI